MVDIRINEWRQLKFHDPELVLRNLRTLEVELAHVEIEPRIRELRTARLKQEREGRDAALFAFGMSHRLGTTVYVAPVEAADYDFVTTFEVQGTQHFVPVQLKELVPAKLNPTTTLTNLLAKLRSLPIRPSTSLALRLNREGREELPFDAFAGLPYSEAWLFWAASADADEWRLYGDVLTQPQLTEYRYPA